MALIVAGILSATVSTSAPPKTEKRFRYAETEFGRSLDATSGGLSVSVSSHSGDAPFTIQLRARVEARSARTDNYLLDLANVQGKSMWRLYAVGHGGVRFEWDTGDASGVTGGPLIADDRWHDVAVLLESRRIRVFVDRHLVADEKVADDFMEGESRELWIGQAANGERGCDGLIDDVSLSKGVLQPSEVWTRDRQSLAFVDFEETNAEYLAQWTPLRTTRRNAEPWEKEDDDDWIDDRFQRMDKGRVFACSTSLPGHNVGKKTLSIALGEARGPLESGPMVMFDTQKCLTVAGLDQASIRISPRRFGILEMPVLSGEERFFVDAAAGWTRSGAQSAGATTTPQEIPVHYRGYHRHRETTVLSYDVDGANVLESTELLTLTERSVFRRRLTLDNAHTAEGPIRLSLFSTPGRDWSHEHSDLLVARDGDNVIAARLLPSTPSVRLLRVDSRLAAIEFPSGQSTADVLVWSGPVIELGQLLDVSPQPIPPLGEFIRGGPAHWSGLVTQGTRDEAPGRQFQIDSITPPFDNPWNSLFFLTGVDFFSAGSTAVVCTVHGDVWLVEGIDERLEEVRWRRFASGLYQPLGLRIVNDLIHVLGRDQITRLHDLNHDGEADFYENFNNDLEITGTPHAYASCLETDPAGNFYFFKCGRSLPHGGKLLKVSPDGRNLSVFASGYRHPIGLGISPDGLITAADNQGNWVPSSSIQVVAEGSFHGYMPELHQSDTPDEFDPPLCWIPISEDNASGGQVWVPTDVGWGPFSGKMLHFSWGRCTMHLVMPEVIEGQWQGGVTRVPDVKFTAGPVTGRFNRMDGHLYVVGLDGWQTAAAQDGCLQRLRYRGDTPSQPLSIHAHANGLLIAFTAPLERHTAALPQNWRIEQWQYRWSEEYGSPELSIVDPHRVGHDPVTVEHVTIADDGRAVFLHIPDIAPVMQMEISGTLKDGSGADVPLTIYNTIHRLAPHWSQSN